MKNGKLYCAMIFSVVIFLSIVAKNETIESDSLNILLNSHHFCQSDGMGELTKCLAVVDLNENNTSSCQWQIQGEGLEMHVLGPLGPIALIFTQFLAIILPSATACYKIYVDKKLQKDDSAASH